MGVERLVILATVLVFSVALQWCEGDYTPRLCRVHTKAAMKQHTSIFQVKRCWSCVGLKMMDLTKNIHWFRLLKQAWTKGDQRTFRKFGQRTRNSYVYEVNIYLAQFNDYKARTPSAFISLKRKRTSLMKKSKKVNSESDKKGGETRPKGRAGCSRWSYVSCRTWEVPKPTFFLLNQRVRGPAAVIQFRSVGLKLTFVRAQLWPPPRRFVFLLVCQYSKSYLHILMKFSG